MAAVVQTSIENDFFYVREVDVELARAARRIVFDHLHLRPIDALHLATAIDLGCDVLYTYDDDLLRLDGEYGQRIERPA